MIDPNPAVGPTPEGGGSLGHRLRAMAGGLDPAYRKVFLAEASILVLLLGLIKLAAVVLSPTGFGEFMLMRSTMTLSFPVILLGLGVAVPRYVAIATADRSGSSPAEYLTSALILLGVTVTVTLVTTLLIAEQIATTLFGSADLERLVLPLVAMVAGWCLHSLTYSYFRGLLQMNRANTLQVINSAVVPLGALLLTQDVPEYFLATAAGWVAVTVAALLVLGVRLHFGSLRAKMVTLARYGSRRVPGDFFMVALLALPVTFTAHVAGVAEAGHVSLGITVVGILGAAFTPIGIVLLPRSSRAFASDELDDLRREVRLILILLSAVAVPTIVVTLLFAPALIEAFLGPDLEGAGAVVGPIVVTAWPYGLFIIFRNVIDGFHERAVNGRNAAIALALLVAGGLYALFATREVLTILIAFDVAMITLGGLTLMELTRIFRRRADGADGVAV